MYANNLQYTSSNIVIVPQKSCLLNTLEPESISETVYNCNCTTGVKSMFDTRKGTERYINPNLTYVKISSSGQDTSKIEAPHQKCLKEKKLICVNVQSSQESFEQTKSFSSLGIKKHFDLSEMNISDNSMKEKNGIKAIENVDNQLKQNKNITTPKQKEKLNTKPHHLKGNKTTSPLLKERENDEVDDIVKDIIRRSSLKKTVTVNKKEMNIELTINIEPPHTNILSNKNETKTTEDNLVPLESDLTFLEDFNVDEIVESLDQTTKKNEKIDEDLAVKEDREENIRKILSTKNNALVRTQKLKTELTTDKIFLKKNINMNTGLFNTNKNVNPNTKTLQQEYSSQNINREVESNLGKDLTQITVSSNLTKNRYFDYVHNKKNAEVKVTKNFKTLDSKAFKSKNDSKLPKHDAIINKHFDGHSQKNTKHIKNVVLQNKCLPNTSKTRNQVKMKSQDEVFPVDVNESLDSYKINEHCTTKREQTLKRKNVDNLNSKFVYKIPKIRAHIDNNEKELFNTHTTKKTTQTTMKTLSKPTEYLNDSQVKIHNTKKKDMLIEPLKTNQKKRNNSILDPKCKVSKISKNTQESEAAVSKNVKLKLKSAINTKQKGRSTNLRQSIRKYIEMNYSGRNEYCSNRKSQMFHQNSVSIKKNDAAFVDNDIEIFNTFSNQFPLKNSPAVGINNTSSSETDMIGSNKNDDDRPKTPEHIKKIIEYLELVEGNNVNENENKLESLTEMKPCKEQKIEILKPVKDVITNSNASKIPTKVDKSASDCVFPKQTKLNKRQDTKYSKTVNGNKMLKIKSGINMNFSKNGSSKLISVKERNREKDTVNLNTITDEHNVKVCNSFKTIALKGIEISDLQSKDIANDSEKHKLNTMSKSIQNTNTKKLILHDSNSDVLHNSFKTPNKTSNDVNNKTYPSKHKKHDIKDSNNKIVSEKRDNRSNVAKFPSVKSNRNLKFIKTINHKKYATSTKNLLNHRACSNAVSKSLGEPVIDINENDDKEETICFMDKINNIKSFEHLESTGNKGSATETTVNKIDVKFTEKYICTLHDFDTHDNRINDTENILSHEDSNITPKQKNLKKKIVNDSMKINKCDKNAREESSTSNCDVKDNINTVYNYNIKTTKLSNMNSSTSRKLNQNNITQYQDLNASNNEKYKQEEITSGAESLITSFKKDTTINIDPVLMSAMKSEDKRKVFTSPGACSNDEITKKIPDAQELSQILKLHTALLTMLDDSMFLYFKKRLYKSYNLICEGSFSSILKCRNNVGQDRAVKILRKGYLPRVYKVLKKIQNTIPKRNFHCIPLIHNFKTEHYWSIMMEYYPKNLDEALHQDKKPFCIDTVQDLFRQLVTASFTLKCNGIIHSDINPRHILLNYGHNRLKLCGFDQANMETYYNDSNNLLPTIGTLQYRSPEIILGISEGINSGHSIDIWSIACVVYEMVTNCKLFYGETNSDILFEQIKIIGDISQDTINNAVHGEKYFLNGKFIHKKSSTDEGIFVEQNTKPVKVFTGIIDAYYQQWAKERNAEQRISDTSKLTNLNNLISKMLTMEPKKRITIEFVMANPFIYK